MCRLSSLRSSLWSFLLGRPGKGWWGRHCPSPKSCVTQGNRCRRSLVSAELHKVPLRAYKNSLDGDSCSIRVAQHLTSPVLFSSVVFIYNWLLLNLQHCALGLSLVPEIWAPLNVLEFLYLFSLCLDLLGFFHWPWWFRKAFLGSCAMSISSSTSLSLILK